MGVEGEAAGVRRGPGRRAPAGLGGVQPAGARGARQGGPLHETFVVPAGSYESVYVNMPPFGLGEARGTVAVGRRGERAADRMAA
ncbi:DUF4188 domain-containing protein [Streptomyces sp. NPDC047049]|uniref:monooxygenase family protein n=1 Tax=Streptomyces sp. NPDC047049 TaxID=3156688 RepID=UPI00340B5399